MANEGSASLQLSATKGNYTGSRTVNFKFDIAATPHVSQGVQNISTSAEAVSISSDVATLGFGFFRNLDSTNYVEVGSYVASVFCPFMKLKAGQAGMCPLSPVTVFARSNTAAVDLEYWIVEN